MPRITLLGRRGQIGESTWRRLVVLPGRSGVSPFGVHDAGSPEADLMCVFRSIVTDRFGIVIGFISVT
jgi:hypothetical protein